MNPPICHVCGQPVHGAATNGVGRFYHGECYRTILPPKWHPAERPITLMSHDERVQEGLEQP